MTKTTAASDAGALPATPNGAAMAAALAAAIGTAALGVLVLLGATRIYSAPTLYGPVGGLSTRSTVAVVVWLVAWWLLHRRWREREVSGAPMKWVWVLIALGTIAMFPPVWELLS